MAAEGYSGAASFTALPPDSGTQMQVLLHEPHTWFLLQHGEAFYLDVNCTQSASSLGLLVELNPDEVTGYRAQGLAFIAPLGNEISMCPADYQARHREALVEAATAAAWHWLGVASDA
jgi:hypothetical protein